MAGKLIVITGVTKGIGRSMAEWFIKNGHRVLGCARSKDEISELNQKYRHKKSNFTALDISNRTEVESWSVECLSEFSSPDILINNAAIGGNAKVKTWEHSLDLFDSVMDVNIKGSNYLVYHFLPSMIDAKKGAVINIGSAWGRSAESSKNVSAYCSSKWWMEGYSASLAQEIPEPLTCVTLDPGHIDTPLLRTCFSDRFCSEKQSPETWANKACPFILSIDTTHNGQQLTIL